jgi:hypothetical protein
MLSGVGSSWVMTMIYRTLMLTPRKALTMAAVWAALLLGHLAIDAAFGVNEPVLFLAAALAVPLWAISAAVYTFDNLMLPRGAERRNPVWVPSGHASPGRTD